MKSIVLKPKGELPPGLECELIKPENFIGKNLEGISSIRVFLRGEKIPLREFFTIEGRVARRLDEQQIILEGDFSRVKRIGESMNGGQILIKGDIGHHLGEFMSRGRIRVEGSARNRVGTAMKGGIIEIEKDAGNYIGCPVLGDDKGMTGGKIFIKGNTNSDIGRGIINGEITILGRVHSFVGSYANGGTITVGSITESRIGYKMKNGRISVLDPNFKPPFYFQHLRDKSNFSVYEGDLSCNGKGLLYVRRDSGP